MNRKLAYLRNIAVGGDWRTLLADILLRLYRGFWSVVFEFTVTDPPDAQPVKLKTKFPLADSLDSKFPWGTKYDNSTNRRFVIKMDGLMGKGAMLDLGCAGGRLVSDFRAIGWQAVGLEGSDYSKRMGRAAWAYLTNTHLFTCDITRPFWLSCKFNLITAWEVLEHIEECDLPQLFQNIDDHLLPGGLFIASTTSAPDIHDGVDLHRTKLTNAQWAARLGQFLEPVDLDFKWYEYVRCNFKERSILTFRKP